MVCIGDSVEHDIAGGKGAGLASALVTTGILDGMPRPSELAKLFAAHGAAPDFILPEFLW